jgi:hypothetical protein
MKVLSEEEGRAILEKIRRAPKNRRESYGQFRELRPEEQLSSSTRRKRLQRQGVRAHPRSPLFAPGRTLSVQLSRCGHRTIVDVLETGRIPQRARCSQCKRWSDTLPEMARSLVQSATRTVVAERVEERDGQTFQVKVLALPRRLRKGQAGGGSATDLPTRPAQT